MRHLDPSPSPAAVDMRCIADYDEDEEQFVVIELLVPPTAIVPAPLQCVGTALPVVLQASVTSTVPPTVVIKLRANNTAVVSAWRITATLSAPQPGRQQLVC